MANEKTGLTLKTLTVLMVMMIVIAAIISYGFMYFFTPGTRVTEIVTESFGPTYNLGDYLVNLAGSGGYQYIKADVVVEADRKQVITELDKRNPQIRDIIISVLREQKIADIEEPGAHVLKNQIMAKLNESLSSGRIVSVWFTQLVVQ